MIKKGFNKFILVLALTFLGVFLYSPATFLPSDSPVLPRAYAGFFSDDLEAFDEVLDLVEDKYVYPPDFKKIFTHAIQGMVHSVDPENDVVKTAAEGEVAVVQTGRSLGHLDYSRHRDMKVFRETYYFLSDTFKDKTSGEKLETAGLHGMIGALDSFSQFLDRESFEKSLKDTEGKYGGVGIVIVMRDYRLVVVKTMKNSPAERAGIVPGDIITKVNDRPIKGLQMEELVDELRGYPDTRVKMTLFRPSDESERDLTLVREIISVETVAYQLLKNKTGYFRITSFSKTTEDQLREGLGRARQDGVKSVILDLRDNPGGLLEQSVKVASHFLNRGKLVVYTQGRKRGDRYEYHAQYDNTFVDLPVVILINHYSASASEIVAGSLRESGKALLLGENTFGKGSVQTMFRISNGAGLRLTTSKYYTPSGIDITKNGIAPDILIVNDLLQEESRDSKKPFDPRDIRPDEQVQLKVSEVLRIMKDRGMKDDGNKDPLIQFSLLILKDNSRANKKYSLEKARELAANIHF